MYKEIDCLIPILVLLSSHYDSRDVLENLDFFFLKMLENDVLCKDSDFYLLGEKLEKISQDKNEALNILCLNQQALGLVEINIDIETDKSTVRLIDSLFGVLTKMKLGAGKNKASQKAVKKIIIELIDNKINDSNQDIKELLNY